MNRNEFLRGELIGLSTCVVDACNPCLVGVSGVVVDETKQTLVVGEKRLVKDQVTLQFGERVVCGSQLVGRSWQRLKRVRRKNG